MEEREESGGEGRNRNRNRKEGEKEGKGREKGVSGKRGVWGEKMFSWVLINRCVKKVIGF